MPAGSAPTERHAWLEQVTEHSHAQLLRADAHANLLEVARVLARCADWDTLTTRPTWERICDHTGLSRRTVAKWLAWLRSAGLLGVVETGSSRSAVPSPSPSPMRRRRR